MTIICQNCSSRLQLDESKAPARPFTIRCPKCNANVNSNGANPASEKSALSVGGSPSTDHPRFEQPNAAPAFESGEPATVGPNSGVAADDLARLLASLLGQQKSATIDLQRERPSWSRRLALVCTTEGKRGLVARKLSEQGYKVFVAEDTRQAVERMRENQLDVVLLDPEFDPVEQGAAFVTREVNILRPAQRRRVFFGLLSASLRTLDSHTAFLNNANVVVNHNDLENVAGILERSLREYNELYSDFNRAMNLPAL